MSGLGCNKERCHLPTSTFPVRRTPHHHREFHNPLSPNMAVLLPVSPPMMLSVDLSSLFSLHIVYSILILGIRQGVSTIKQCRLLVFLLAGPVPCGRDFFLTSRNAVGASYQLLQRHDISSSTKLLAKVDAGLMPVSSPLTPVLPSQAGDSVSSAATKPSKVQAVLKGIRQSPKKVNLVAQLVRGMPVEDALVQLQVTVKRAAKTIYQVIKSARANASNNHGMDPHRLLVAEAFVGKGRYLKRISYHAKGRCGVMVRPHCHVTVVVREMTAEEDAKIAKLKLMNYKKLTKEEKRLVPHKLIEVTPRWSRRPRGEIPSKVEA